MNEVEQTVNLRSLQAREPGTGHLDHTGQYRSIFLQNELFPETALQFFEGRLIDRLGRTATKNQRAQQRHLEVTVQSRSHLEMLLRQDGCDHVARVTVGYSGKCSPGFVVSPR